MIELITKAIEDGLDDDAIASLVAQQAQKNVSASEIAAEIVAQRKKNELQKAVKDAKEAQKAQELIDSQIEAKLDAKLEDITKKINIATGAGKVACPKTHFNFALGKTVELTDAQSEAFGHFGKALNFLKDGDKNNYEAIQREINHDVASKLSEKYGEKVAVSDVAAQGGRLIPVEVSDQALIIAYQESTALQYVHRETIAYNQAKFPVMGDSTVTWKATQSTQLTEATPTIYDVSVTPSDFYAFQYMSNKLIVQRGQTLVDQFIQSIGSAIAKKIDQVVAVGSVSGNNDGATGLAFDDNTNVLGPVALSAMTMATIDDLIESVIAVTSENTVLMANMQVMFAIGKLADAGGNRYFPDFVQRGADALRPYGLPFLINKQIPKRIASGSGALNFTTKNRTSGTETALVCADMSKVIVAMSDTLRIDVSDSFRFDYDQRALRVIGSFGQTVASGSTTAGIVASVQRLS